MLYGLTLGYVVATTYWSAFRWPLDRSSCARHRITSLRRVAGWYGLYGNRNTDAGSQGRQGSGMGKKSSAVRRKARSQHDLRPLMVCVLALPPGDATILPFPTPVRAPDCTWLSREAWTPR